MTTADTSLHQLGKVWALYEPGLLKSGRSGKIFIEQLRSGKMN
jgi:hypothetical protein